MDPEELKLVEQIKARPGQWFKIAEYDGSAKASTIAGSIGAGKRKAFRGSGIEAKSRKLPTRIEQGTGEERIRYAVFVRFPD